MPKSKRKNNIIYLDHASSAIWTSPNAGAIHDLGVKEKNKLENARTTIAKILSAHNSEIILTSGATESNNLAIFGLIQKQNLTLRPLLNKERVGERSNLPHIVTTNIEHASVLAVCRHLEKTKQAEVTYVPVEENGIIDPKKIKKALRSDTVLVSVMYANNEIGTIQPIREIAKEIRHFNKNVKRKVFEWSGWGRDPENRGPEKTSPFNIFFHTDATQAINYLPISIPQLGVDLMSFNGAKIYGPKGAGVLYVKKDTPINPIMFGGEQEFGLRPGTENVAFAVKIAKALEDSEKIKEKEIKRLIILRDYFITKLKKVGLIINGDLKNRLPNNINVTVPNIPSDLLVIELSARGIMASAKSACKSGDGKVSHVIKAIHKNIKETDGSLRFSLGRETTKSDIDFTVKTLSEILTKLKKWY